MEKKTEIKVSGIFTPGNGSLKELIKDIKEIELEKNVKCSLIHAEVFYARPRKETRGSETNRKATFYSDNKSESAENGKMELRITSEFTLLWATWLRLIDEVKEIEKEYNCHCTLIQTPIIKIPRHKD